jgi:hypothetical protein
MSLFLVYSKANNYKANNYKANNYKVKKSTFYAQVS